MERETALGDGTAAEVRSDGGGPCKEVGPRKLPWSTRGGPGCDRTWAQLGRPLRGAGRGRAESLATSRGDAPRRRSGAPWRSGGTERGPGAAAMDIPPLPGKIAALSLGVLPVSYALNHVSALSQCVRGAARRRAAPGVRKGSGEGAHRLAGLSA